MKNIHPAHEQYLKDWREALTHAEANLTREEMLNQLGVNTRMGDYRNRQTKHQLAVALAHRAATRKREEQEQQVACKRCGKDTDVLAVFPGGICLDCHAAKEGAQPLTAAGFNSMVNTFRGKGVRRG